MHFYQTRSKKYQFLTNFLIITLGVVALSALLSVRSWYKPSIKLNRISPVTIVLDKDVDVIDKFSTKLAKEQARQKAIKNTTNKEIFDIDEAAQEESFNKLKFAVKVVRNTILNIQPEPDPINPKVSIETQNFFLNVNEEKFNELLLNAEPIKILSAEEFFTNLSFTKDYDVDEIVADVKRLSEVEVKYFFSEISDLRKEIEYQKDIKKQLSKEFFDLIRSQDYEAIFKQTFLVQKKLLDLGIVRGLPKQKVVENISILFPSIVPQNLNLISKLINISTLPNIQIDWQEVNILEEEAIEAVEPIMTQLKSGSVLANKGKVVSEQNYKNIVS